MVRMLRDFEPGIALAPPLGGEGGGDGIGEGRGDEAGGAPLPQVLAMDVRVGEGPHALPFYGRTVNPKCVAAVRWRPSAETNSFSPINRAEAR